MASNVPFNLSSEVINPVQPKDDVVKEHDPLNLDIDDDELIKIIDKRIKASQKFFNDTYHLDAKREKNETYLFGRQLSENEKMHKYRPYEARYLDNAIYEIEASIKPVAVGRMPDMVVTPGNNDTSAKETANNITLIVNDELKTRENRRVLALGFKHIPVYYTGIIKVKWNPENGEYGDYEFSARNPQNIVVDEQCSSNNSDKMKFIAEATKLTVQEVIMRFPLKEKEFRKQLQRDGVITSKPTDEWKNKATSVKIWEVWFTWYNKKDNGEYERIEGVMWKYKDVLLKKMRNPNFDYKGKAKYFKYEMPGDETTRQEVSDEEILQAAMSGILPENMQKDIIFNNYFDMPHKPYFFMGSEQWGKVAYDETSRIEQNIRNQENLDTIGKRVIEKLKNNGKHVISKESGMTAKDMEKTDFNNPDQDLLVDGNVNNVHSYINPIPPSSQEFGELKLTRERMFSLAGATNLTGVLQSDVATSNQIARESNFTRIDDLTEETINSAAEWMSQWAMQMIKLRYTHEHMRRILGSKGDVTFMRIRSDMVQDGMEVKIKASATDKIKNQRNAMEMAKMGMIDPLQFCEDMDLSDAQGRAEKMMLFKMSPQEYYTKYIMQKGPEELAGILSGEQPQEGLPAQPPPAQPGGPQAPPAPQSGPAAPQGPSPLNTAAVPTTPPMGVAASPANGML